MSQVSIIDIEGNHPEIPTQFDANIGFAIPIGNVLEILGDTSAAGTTPVHTEGSGNTITTFVQISQAIAATDATKIGLSAFDSSNFNVDANGFVSLKGGSLAIDSVAVDASTAPGTNPVMPDGTGLITVTGAQVVSSTVGANVIRSNSIAANTFRLEIQQSGSSAAGNTTLNGVAHFNSDQFSVSSGFVSLIGGGEAIDSIAVQTGTSPVVPTAAGLITINGAVVAAGTNPIRSHGTGANTLALEVQISQAIAATDATKIGLANFDSAAFDVDANGFVQLNGGGIAATSFDVQANTAPGTDPVVPTAAGVVTVNGAAVANHSVVLETRSRAANAYNLEVQYSAAAAATDATKSGVSHFNSSQFSVDANGFVSATGTIALTTTENSGSATPSGGNLNILGPNSGLTGYSPWTTGSGATATINMPGTVKWVVNATANLGTHTTIQAAITAASSGDDVFITPGTYTENLTLKAGVNLTAYECDTGTVIILGTCTMTTAGSVTISGVQLKTNSAALLAVTGSAASIVNLVNCIVNCTNNTGITFSSSNASATININKCLCDLATTGIALFTHTSSGILSIIYSILGNSGGSSTANTISSGILVFNHAAIANPLTTSSTAQATAIFTSFDTSAQNATCLTAGGSGSHRYDTCRFLSGSASAISVGNTTTVLDVCSVTSTNTNAITGAGTVSYSPISFIGSSSNINTTTQTILKTGPSATFGSTNSGNTNTLTVTNDSNTATSAANIVSSVAGGTAADPTHQSVVSGVTTWTWGIDNSASDAWVLAQGTALGTNNVISATTAGEVTKPLQPAFSADSTLQSNVTGDGTAYTITYATEIFDQNNDFDGTSTFTAPVTGLYQFNALTGYSGLTAGMTDINTQIATSNRSYSIQGGSPGAMRSVNNTLRMEGTVLADMDAADTTVVSITISNGTKVANVTATSSKFQGFLVC